MLIYKNPIPFLPFKVYIAKPRKPSYGHKLGPALFQQEANKHRLDIEVIPSNRTDFLSKEKYLSYEELVVIDLHNLRRDLLKTYIGDQFNHEVGTREGVTSRIFIYSGFANAQGLLIELHSLIHEEIETGFARVVTNLKDLRGKVLQTLKELNRAKIASN